MDQEEERCEDEKPDAEESKSFGKYMGSVSIGYEGC